MKIKVGNLTPILYFLILPFFPSCGSDPVAVETEDSFHIADYLPLEAGYSRKYSYSIAREVWSNDGSAATASGYCTLTVDEVFEDGSTIMASLEIAIKITDTNIHAFPDTTFSSNFNILQTLDTIWYVTGAPSLERLNEGTRAPMMFFREDSSLFADLKMFALDFREIFYYAKEVYVVDLPLKPSGEPLEFNLDTVNHGSQTHDNEAKSIIILRREKGIQTIESLFIYSGSLTRANYLSVKLALIE